MDWCYPVLTGLRPPAVLSADWNLVVQPGHGVRCVHHEPWTTGGETTELASTLAARGETAHATELLGTLDTLSAGDGSYWTGYNNATDTIWPRERTTWTAGAALLAHAALQSDPATVDTFTPTAR